MRKIFLLIATAAFLSSCGGGQKTNKTESATGAIKIDGSSTVYPVSEAVAEEFRAIQPNVNVTVGESGTGGGFKKFSRNEIDISDASRPITVEEIEACTKAGINFIEIPVAFDGLAVVVSKQNTFIDHLTVAELKKLWEPAAQGTVKTWDQIRSSFPKEPIKLYGAGTASGTYDYFTEAICGKKGASRGDYTASEDDNVLVQGVSNDKNGLAYFGLAYYEQNIDKLKLIPVDNGNGPIAPSQETVGNGTYQPLSRPEFIYVNAKSAERKEVQDFVKFYIQNAGKLAKEIGYVPLGDAEYKLAEERFTKKVTGTMFANGKSIVGTKMSDLLKLEEGK
ncbi:PstS family phosphate ABC transporter substrate-binding protein [Solitalea canadensis]|uniref:Phosphate-binding protein n=1 Tax=Solitalea canadensis (strain ATCC 29591 / DSM 3403 / JCM 21819 / LMG 8368 / NBRC 15130 / NCIMB 12057 / USAM 9D) TaxID=929556 RepID=H8KWN2_SOLCM|nr:PstS family phosphate ABC transporter substrate-binding protein [Solitalea canadensis]AFD08211.1 phosphate binding protein [Solitalea canadensis DSM 3403]